MENEERMEGGALERGEAQTAGAVEAPEEAGAEGSRGKRKKEKKGKKKRRGLKICLGVLGVAAVIVALALWARSKSYEAARLGHSPYTADAETVARLSPVDAAAAARIDALPQGSAEESWAFYFYVNGSDLEEQGRDYLSATTDMLLKAQNEAFLEAEEERKAARIREFADGVLEKGSFLPAALTLPDYEKKADKSGSIAPDSDEPVQDVYGYASIYLEELMRAELGGNIQIVVQPGGSKAWDSPDINPNRTQRFVVGNGRLNEVYDGELENMGEAETLSNFLNFCKTNYPADNTVVVLFDHGGASRGFGWDEIFARDNLTLKELRAGFSGAYTPNEADPPIDLVYYHACLLSCAEMMDAMRGICDYMLAGEEVGLVGKNITYYEDSLNALSENPAMHPAQFARHMVDNYMTKIVSNTAILGYQQPTGLCVLDMRKAPAVYDAYCDFAAAALEEAVENPVMLRALTTAACQSTFFAASSYKGYNTIDLGQFMDGMARYLPQEAAAVQAAIDEAVLYKRANTYLIDADGISIYYPAHIETLGGLDVFLQYVHEICGNDDIRALYYYKVAGCLNDELDAYVRSKYGKAETLDYAVMKGFQYLPVDVEPSGNMRIALPEDMLALTGDVYLQLARYDKDEDRLLYLGQDRFVDVDENGVTWLDFEGRWLTIGGVPFPVSVIDSTQEAIKYQSHIELNGYDRYLILRYVFDTEQFEILGVRDYQNEADLLDRNILDLTPGDTITPVYTSSGPGGGRLETHYGKKVHFKEDTPIEDGALEDGLYYMRIVLEDLRSDRYYAPIVEFSMQNGLITAPALNTAARMARVSY